MVWQPHRGCVVRFKYDKKSKTLRTVPVCTGPSVDIQAHTLPVCSIEMISSMCSRWTVVISPRLLWLEPSCSVLSEGGFFLLFPPYRFHLPSKPVFRFGTLSDSAQLVYWLVHEAVRLYGNWTKIIQHFLNICKPKNCVSQSHQKSKLTILY